MTASKRPARALVKRFLRQNPAATNEQVSKALGVSQRLVTLARSELALEGRPVRAAGDYTSGLAKTEEGELAALETIGLRDLEPQMRALEAQTGHPVTLDEQVALLSARIRDPKVPSQVLGGLVTVLQRLRPPDKARVGPPEPLEIPGRIKRLSLLMQACGLEVVQGALLTAGFTGQVALAERQPNVAQDSGPQAPQEPVPEPGATPDDYAARALAAGDGGPA